MLEKEECLKNTVGGIKTHFNCFASMKEIIFANKTLDRQLYASMN